MTDPTTNEKKPLGARRLIVIGFWIGTGFVVPALVADALSAGIVLGSMRTLFSDDASAIIPGVAGADERIEKLVVLETRESQNGTQMVILGSLRNDSDDSIGGIQLEAELTDATGKFVYECSEYMSGKLKAGATEAFQIACGCGSNPAPAHAAFTVRVVSTSSF